MGFLIQIFPIASQSQPIKKQHWVDGASEDVQ
jgi:hypothetical protein